MGVHRRKPGQALIQRLTHLGESLGYCVVPEWPIPNTGTPPQQIDLCWFRDGSMVAPLFAFEIESRDVPAATNNAQKLFAKHSDHLLKPLFMFHVFLEGNEASPRLVDLRESYGRFNYRVYNATALESLAQDILSQHRRVTSELNILAMTDIVSSAEALNSLA